MPQEYKVVCSENKPDRLVREVNKLVGVGWQPLGGVSVSRSHDPELERMSEVYAQALVRSL